MSVKIDSESPPAKNRQPLNVHCPLQAPVTFMRLARRHVEHFLLVRSYRFPSSNTRLDSVCVVLGRSWDGLDYSAIHRGIHQIFPELSEQGIDRQCAVIDRYLSRQQGWSIVGVFHRFEKFDRPDLLFVDLRVDHQLCRFEHHPGFDAVRDVVVLFDRI